MMKRIFTIALAAMMLASCKKESVQDKSSVHCYECDFGSGWDDKGCMTTDEWNRVQFTDAAGNQLSKSNCRIK